VAQLESLAIQFFDTVNEHTQDHDLVRIDLNGAPSRNLGIDLTAAYQALAIKTWPIRGYDCGKECSHDNRKHFFHGGVFSLLQ
jgi:hypothetical protein